MKYRKFSDLGWNVSEIGIGCWAIGSEWGDVSENDAKDALYASLDNGINIQVPPFIEVGDEIVVDTRTIEYVKKI